MSDLNESHIVVGLLSGIFAIAVMSAILVSEESSIATKVAACVKATQSVEFCVAPYK